MLSQDLDLDDILASRSEDEILASRSESPGSSKQAEEPRFAVESVSTVSGELSDYEDERIAAHSSRLSGGSKASNEEASAVFHSIRQSVRESARELYELEEKMKDEHLLHVQNMAEMLQEDCRAIQSIEKRLKQPRGSTGRAMDEYVVMVAELADRKEVHLNNLKSAYDLFRKLKKELEG